MKPVHAIALALSVLLTTAHADDLLGELDPIIRAKLMKQKLRMSALESSALRKGGGADGEERGTCSQEIGTFDTKGRAGTMPREVVIYAPNAINIASGRGCR